MHAPTATEVSATAGGTDLESWGHPFGDGFGDALGHHLGDGKSMLLVKPGFGARLQIQSRVFLHFESTVIFRFRQIRFHFKSKKTFNFNPTTETTNPAKPNVYI